MPHEATPSAADVSLLHALELAFARAAVGAESIDAPALQKALGLRSVYLAHRLLANFDRNGDGVVGREEFFDGVRRLLLGSDRDKLLFAFRLHDDDGDGSLSHEELLRMISIALSESQVVTRSDDPERLAHLLFLKADTNRDGRVSFEEFESVVRDYPALLLRMTQSDARWFSLENVTGAPPPVGARSLRSVLENRRVPLLLLALWVGLNVGVLALGLRPPAASASGKHPVTVLSQLNRVCTTCLNLNAALLLVPVMRRFLTWVRSSRLGRALPVDDAVMFHRLVGHAMFAYSVAHGALTLLAYRASTTKSFSGQLLTTRALSGLGLLGVFAVMWLFALSVIRRTRHFELFYFTHLLFVVWFALALVHAPSIVGFSAAALLGFGIEQILRLRRRAPEVRVLACEPLRSGVTRLELARPSGFSHHAGDYVFLRIPAVARHEWHPYTLSSAPESPSLTVHARSLGNWSTALHARAEEEARRGVRSLLAAHIDGPYGSPSGHVFDVRFAVLIGAGIGVTPFASVLESLLLRAGRAGAAPRLERVHFFWLNRDQISFEWFGALLARLEAADPRGLLDIHICMTGGLAGSSALVLELARELLHERERRDIVTGLRTLTHMGPPDWDAALGAIARQHHPERVEVFFCGPPGLGATIRPVCAKLGMPFREERF